MRIYILKDKDILFLRKKNKMVKKVHIFLVGVLLLPFGCKKKDNPMPVEETDPSVYVAGVIYTDRYQGCVWQDGAITLRRRKRYRSLGRLCNR